MNTNDCHCPSCGRCRHCGAPKVEPAPVYVPFIPTYPIYPNTNPWMPTSPIDLTPTIICRNFE